MELGKQIAYYRKQKELTQDALAKQLNISNQAVSKWESNQSYPDITLLVQLADIFEISLDQLFGRTCENTQANIAMDALPWEDDGELRAVIYIGKHLVMNEQLTREQQQICEHVTFEHEGEALNISSEFNVSCNDVKGNVTAGNNVDCNNIGGNVQAANNVDCNNIAINLSAGNNVDCNNIGGNVAAGNNIDCNNIEGMVTAYSVTCENIGGDIYAQKTNTTNINVR